MRIDSSGNVGIGTTAPGYKLEVNGDIRTGSGGDLRLGSATGTTAATGDSSIYNDANNMIFATGTTTAERMRLDSVGQFGIGCAPGYRLDVAAGDTTAGLGYAMRLRSNATAAAAAIQFTNSPVSAQNGLISCTDAGVITVQGDSATSAVVFRTNGNERVRIDRDGNFLVNTTAPMALTSRSEYKETLVGAWPLALNGNNRGLLVRNSDATSGIYAFFEYNGGTNN
jgi:hypothetical protein